MKFGLEVNSGRRPPGAVYFTGRILWEVFREDAGQRY